MDSKRLGIFGEKIARDYLVKKGYKILDKNYSPYYIAGPKRGEIDIIAKKDGIISFVEVKTLRDRASAKGFFPEMKVDFQKQKKIIKTAEDWLRKKQKTLNVKWQIDVISIRINSDSKKAKIRYFKNV